MLIFCIMWLCFFCLGGICLFLGDKLVFFILMFGIMEFEFNLIWFKVFVFMSMFDSLGFSFMLSKILFKVFGGWVVYFFFGCFSDFILMGLGGGLKLGFGDGFDIGLVLVWGSGSGISLDDVWVLVCGFFCGFIFGLNWGLDEFVDVGIEIVLNSFIFGWCSKVKGELVGVVLIMIMLFVIFFCFLDFLFEVIFLVF